MAGNGYSCREPIIFRNKGWIYVVCDNQSECPSFDLQPDEDLPQIERAIPARQAGRCLTRSSDMQMLKKVRSELFICYKKKSSVQKGKMQERKRGSERERERAKEREQKREWSSLCR